MLLEVNVVAALENIQELLNCMVPFDIADIHRKTTARFYGFNGPHMIQKVSF